MTIISYSCPDALTFVAAIADHYTLLLTFLGLISSKTTATNYVRNNVAEYKLCKIVINVKLLVIHVQWII